MLLFTGKKRCFDEAGRKISCHGSSGQDEEYRIGKPWTEPRFDIRGKKVLDRLTGLTWSLDANLSKFPVTWQEAIENIEGMNRDHYLGCDDWRLLNSQEFRSLMNYQTG